MPIGCQVRCGLAAFLRRHALELSRAARSHQGRQAGFTESGHTIQSIARGLAYHYAYIGLKRLGAGQFYLINIKDKDAENYDGSKTYRLHVPPDVPIEQYWSLTAYDRETHALIKNVDRASRAPTTPK